MAKIGIIIDYSDICKDYNTGFLDRDNLDPATKKCMRQVMNFSKDFLNDFANNFDLKLFNLSSDISVSIDDIASKRFLFYSLEKEITLQSYVMSQSYVNYDSLTAWDLDSSNTFLIQNDEDGGNISLYFNQGSPASAWIKEWLPQFELVEIPFQAIK